MTTFLLLLSLMLNAAAIFAIILLYLRQNRLAEAEKKQEKIIKEIEEVFSTYLFELKEENDKFLELMTKRNIQAKTGEKTAVAVDDSGEKADAGSGESSQEPQRSLIGKRINYQAARNAYKKNNQAATDREESVEIENLLQEEPVPETKELSFIEKVVSMKNQGLTTEEIARELDKGKTEIELLLKFRQNTQE